ncbi:hypothetical protein, partial [Klebsiella aerogenes]|uniref:hypothetical protein n=1 Tax=Klebsiella aerogenes TaxID=548 RepID=UPI001953D487
WRLSSNALAMGSGEVDPNFSYEQYTDYVWNILKGNQHYTVEVRFVNKGARLVCEYEQRKLE